MRRKVGRDCTRYVFTVDMCLGNTLRCLSLVCFLCASYVLDVRIRLELFQLVQYIIKRLL